MVASQWGYKWVTSIYANARIDKINKSRLRSGNVFYNNRISVFFSNVMLTYKTTAITSMLEYISPNCAAPF